jgi:hypothetical protein
LLACNKEESVRLQKEQTIILGTVTEQQRGLVLEGATVYLLEYLYPGNDDKCGTCQKIIDSTLTDANGNFEFRFNAKQGANWNYKTWCEKQNYITKIASRFNDIVKSQSNTANLALYATGDFELIFYNHVTTEWTLIYGNGIDYNYSGAMAKFNLENVEAYTQFKISATYCKKINCDANTIWKEEYFEVEANKTTKDTLHFYGY